MDIGSIGHGKQKGAKGNGKGKEKNTIGKGKGKIDDASNESDHAGATPMSVNVCQCLPRTNGRVLKYNPSSG